jgi:hypothetical protein
MSIFDNVTDAMVPRDGRGRVRLDLLPRPPEKQPECIITRDTRCRAWYRRLMRSRLFRADLLALFEDWRAQSIDLFIRRWHLGRNGLRDLNHSRCLWLRRPTRTVGLVIGPRFYGEAAERAGRAVPRVLLSPEKQRVGADRLYRARVLGCSWKDIATWEASEDGRVIIDSEHLESLAEAVRHGAYRWEAALGIPRRNRGRGSR